MPEVQFNTYYRYDDLTRILQGLAEEYPNLVRIESIGKSFEGREIWLAKVPTLKPARIHTSRRFGLMAIFTPVKSRRLAQHSTWSIVWCPSMGITPTSRAVWTRGCSTSVHA